MTISVRYTDDAGETLSTAGSFLETRPVEHNLVLTILTERADEPIPGNYWIVSVDDAIVAVALQSPTHFRGTLTSLAGAPLEALVASVAENAPGIPGIGGEAATVAAFAGNWAETRRVPVNPAEAQRLYRLRELRAPRPTGGTTRLATEDDIELAGRWMAGFHDELGEAPPLDPLDAVRRRVADSRLWIWDDNGPKAMVGCARTVAGVARVGPVYTPPEFRRNGYGAACTAEVSAQLHERLDECVLYTQLANPTSNAIYRGIGYEPVYEVLRYEFGS